MANFPNWLQLTSYRWYKRSFNPYTVEKPFADHGPPERVTTAAITGTGGAGAPAQVCTTLTEITAFPRHWGRAYLPTLAVEKLTNGGRLTSAARIAIAGNAQVLYNDLAVAELFPVVPITQVDGVPARGLLTVQRIQVDDVPDVIRRRRPYATLARSVAP